MGSAEPMEPMLMQSLYFELLQLPASTAPPQLTALHIFWKGFAGNLAEEIVMLAGPHVAKGDIQKLR